MNRSQKCENILKGNSETEPFVVKPFLATRLTRFVFQAIISCILLCKPGSFRLIATSQITRPKLSLLDGTNKMSFTIVIRIDAIFSTVIPSEKFSSFFLKCVPHRECVLPKECYNYRNKVAHNSKWFPDISSRKINAQLILVNHASVIHAH